MTAPAACIREWSAACRFPMRMRLFAAGEVEGVAAEAVWCDASPGERLAAAVGCALAADDVVTVVIDADDLADPLVQEALTLAAATSAPLRCLVTGTPGEPPPGWATEMGPCWLPAAALSVDALCPVAEAATPVHVPCLRQWAEGEGDLAVLHHEAPRVLLADGDPRWSRARPGPALAVALAAAGREGLRPVLTVAGDRIGGWWAQLAAIGRRPTPVCLRVRGAGPPLGWWRSLPGWWVCAPGRGEERAVLARALGSRDHVAILVDDDRLDGVDPEGHEPGGGRWIQDDARAAVVIAGPGCAGRLIAHAQAALATIGLVTATWESTSVHPLALPHDERPLIAVEGTLAGYAEVVRAARGPQVIGLTVGATATEIAAAVRGLVG